jgi:3',5'-cyclic AMP phosphodiesterase CpdA
MRTPPTFARSVVLAAFCGAAPVGAQSPPPPSQPAPAPSAPSQSAPERSAQSPSADPASRFLTSRSSPVRLELPAEDDAFLFAIFGDRTGGPEAGVKVLAQAVADVELIGPDLVMTVGDLIEGYNETPQWLAQMREFRSIMGRLGRPWFPVVGNHDVYWRGRGTPPEREHEEDYEAHFGPLWYAFEHKGCWFVCLHSDEDDPERGDKTFDEPRGQRMSTEQYAWLDATLTRTAGARHVFVFLHHPRWLGRNYGDDWQRVHARLVAAGNVSAVFAGHIHHMRYDGKRDGIEYFALATVGGSQEGIAPSAGFLHEFHLVMVRDDGIEVATLPVGDVIDSRAITGEVSEQVRKLAGALPSATEGSARFAADRSWSKLSIELRNPTSRAAEFTLTPRSDDSRWRFHPDHAHVTLEPGQTRAVELHARHALPLADEDTRVPEVRLLAEWLADGRRFPLPERVVPMTVDLSTLPRATAPTAGTARRTLSLDGKGACARIDSARLAVPDGPFTVEGWFLPRALPERAGLVCKTESSEFGLFGRGDRAEFLVHLAGAYVTVTSEPSLLGVDRWHHVAGVFDGAEVRLYVDGRIAARAPGAGKRTLNSLPLLIGADVNANAEAVDGFAGRIDAIRISTAARYSGDRFEPARQLPIDAATLVAHDFDQTAGPWLLDGGGGGRVAVRTGGATVEDGE